MVAADTDTLKSLPKTEILAGLAEVVKYALVFDRAFARRLDADWRKILRGNAAARERMIRRCVQWKARIVAADERDLSGRRELLNFGHTLGHALESATGFLRFRHGEAVAWGMRGALALSENRGFLSIHDGALAKRLLSRLPKVRRPKGATPAKILRALRGDKKVVDDKNVFILLKRLAAPVRVDNVSRREILRVLSELP